MPVWREYAGMPGFGAYARQWLAAQDEPVAADDKDEAWLLVDTIVQSSGQLGLGMLPLLSGTVQAMAGDSAAEALAGIENCGHPHAADVARMLSGGPAAASRPLRRRARFTSSRSRFAACRSRRSGAACWCRPMPHSANCTR